MKQLNISNGYFQLSKINLIPSSTTTKCTKVTINETTVEVCLICEKEIVECVLLVLHIMQ